MFKKLTITLDAQNVSIMLMNYVFQKYGSHYSWRRSNGTPHQSSDHEEGTFKFYLRQILLQYLLFSVLIHPFRLNCHTLSAKNSYNNVFFTCNHLLQLPEHTLFYTAVDVRILSHVFLVYGRTNWLNFFHHFENCWRSWIINTKLVMVKLHACHCTQGSQVQIWPSMMDF